MKTLFRTLALATAASAALALAVPADASRPVRPGAVQIDPQLGYVLVRIGPTQNQRGRAANLYLWRFDPDRSEIRTNQRRDPARVPRGEDVSAVLGRRPFMSAGETGVFLSSLTPGQYVIHGTDTTCFCLGTYSFTVRPGEVTDIGTVLIGPENGRAEAEALRQYSLSPDILDRRYAVNDVMIVRAAADGDVVPPQLAGLTVTRAELTPDVRFPNRGPVRPLYPRGLLLARAAGLPAPIPGDGAAMVERLRSAEEQQMSLLPRELLARRAAEQRRLERAQRAGLGGGGASGQ
jgi:hypothetical protein